MTRTFLNSKGFRDVPNQTSISQRSEGEMKMNSMKWYVASVVAIMSVATCNFALAVPTIDGNASVADGYASLSVQTTNTQFGDADTGDAINGGGGSEINQVFGKIEGGRLYIVVAGNLETNFNKLEVFIDSETGGQNTLDGSTLPAGVDGFCCGGAPDGALQRMGGGADGLGLEKITFDSGFDADYYLTFTNGFETLRPGLPSELQFYAASAAFAELNNGPTGASGTLGMQLAQRGLPNVLRGTTADFDTDGNVDGSEFLTWQRNSGALGGASRANGDASGDGNVDGADLGIWGSNFGFNVANSSLADFPFAPQSAGIDNSEALIGPALPGLSQGNLLDRTYALGAGGCNADNSGADCVAAELEFVLPIDVANDPMNAFSHRDMNNFVDLQMAFDNSNTAGVTGDSGLAGNYSDPTLEDPSLVTTGIEFSIPLSAIGNPSGTNIRITAFVNGAGHDYLSNQVSGAGTLQENIGPPGFADFSDNAFFPGDQFVTLAAPLSALGTGSVPEPSSLALICLGALACGLTNRQRANR